MGESRVVRPRTKRVEISNGDWLLLKKRLNHGEQQEAFAHKYITENGLTHLNLKLVGMDRVLAFLVDWSLTDLDGDIIDIRGKSSDDVEIALNSLDPDSFKEIKEAVRLHEIAMDAEREAEKNGKDGEKKHAATSPSPSAAVGELTGSVS